MKTSIELMREMKDNKTIEYTKNVKTHNKLIESLFQDNNLIVLKLLFYISKNADKIKLSKNEIQQILLKFSNIRDITGISRDTVIINIEKLMKTIITIPSDDNMKLEKIPLFSKTIIHFGESYLQIDMYTKILMMIKDVEKYYTKINIDNLFRLKNKHSIRMLLILEQLKGYDKHVPKRKYYSIDELKLLFGVKYKSSYDIKRFLLEKCKIELDNNSYISFVYKEKYNNSSTLGRPKVEGFYIDLIINTNRQGVLF